MKDMINDGFAPALLLKGTKIDKENKNSS